MNMLHKGDLKSIRGNRGYVDHQHLSKVEKYTYLGATVNKQEGGVTKT